LAALALAAEPDPMLGLIVEHPTVETGLEAALKDRKFEPLIARVSNTTALCRLTRNRVGVLIRGLMHWRNTHTLRRTTGFIPPCLPTLADAVPDNAAWVHEIKHDGYRFICRWDGDRVRAFTRRGYDWTDRVPRIAEALAALPVTSVTIDGEAVVCDPAGVSDFDRLRGALARRGSPEAFLYAFDLLELDGHDLRQSPWADRREALVRVLSEVDQGIRLSEHLDGDGPAMFQHACAMGLEGIVSKRRDRPYRSGRSPDWIKVKNPNAPAATRIIDW